MKEKKIGKKKLTAEAEQQTQAINHEHENLIKWFQIVKFRKRLRGGVDEAYLWKKLEELNRLYEASISAERARYDALISECQKGSDVRIRRYKQELVKKDIAGQDLKEKEAEKEPGEEERR